MSVRPHGTTRLPLDGFNGIWYLGIFRKTVGNIQVLLKIRQQSRVIQINIYVYLSYCLVEFFLKLEMP